LVSRTLLALFCTERENIRDPQAFVATILRRRWFELLRSRRRTVLTDFDDEETTPFPPSEPNDMALIMDLIRAIEALPNDQKEASLRIFVTGESAKAAASILGGSRSTVDRNKNKARRTLKALLAVYKVD
jgi:DNA-directed RNA polymerase specialized sigma24 family protein